LIEVIVTIRPWNAGSAALRDHDARHRLAEEVRALQVGPDDLVECLLGGLEEVAPPGGRDPRVVHERVDPPERRERPLHDRAACLRLRDVPADVDRLAPGRAQLLDHRRDDVVRPSAVDRDPPALGGEVTGDAQPDPPRAARDERDAPGHDPVPTGPKNV
jgi:hypothetical protein